MNLFVCDIIARTHVRAAAAVTFLRGDIILRVCPIAGGESPNVFVITINRATFTGAVVVVVSRVWPLSHTNARARTHMSTFTRVGMSVFARERCARHFFVICLMSAPFTAAAVSCCG